MVTVTVTFCEARNPWRAVAPEAVPPKYDPALSAAKLSSKVADIIKTIEEGSPGTAMLSFKAQLSPEEIDALARFVRAFDKTLKPEKVVKGKK